MTEDNKTKMTPEEKAKLKRILEGVSSSTTIPTTIPRYIKPERKEELNRQYGDNK